jgi:competence protein ComGC
MNLLEKKAVSFEELEAQNAFELPNREMLLVTVVITNLLTNVSIPVTVANNNIAVQVCAIVELIDAQLFGIEVDTLQCDIQQGQGGGKK